MMTMTRREMMAGSAGALLVTRLGQDPYGGFKMGAQTYSLRNFDLDGCLQRMQDMGLKYAEFFNGKQMEITTDKAKIDGYKEKLSKAGVTILSFGVVRFTKDHEKNKAIFDFGKAMGLKCFSANPDADSFDSLTALTKEYGITIGIHNHGPDDKRYGLIDQLAKAVEKYPEAIGACVDTGHTIRAGEDPVKAIRTFGKRVHDVHLKDAIDAKTFAICGKGKLDVVGTLRALKEIGFTGCMALEYEEKPQDPVADMKECLAAVREAVKKL